MNANDKKRLTEILIAAMSVYEVVLTKMTRNMWISLLDDLDVDDIGNAFKTWMKNNDRAPKPSNIREIVLGAPSLDGREMLRKIDEALSRGGNPVFDDPIIHHVVNAHGGMQRLGSLTQRDYGFEAERMVRSYIAFKKRGVDGKPAPRLTSGRPGESTTYIGDIARCKKIEAGFEIFDGRAQKLLKGDTKHPAGLTESCQISRFGVGHVG